MMGAATKTYLEIRKLAQVFYADYPHSLYPELLTDENRPYCIAVFCFSTYYVGVPFRTYLRHNNGFVFSKRKLPHSRPGLDYSKMIVFTDTRYLGALTTVDNNQQIEFVQNIATISDEIINYITRYIEHVKGIKPLHRRAFQRLYGYSTLKYFHDILGI